MLYHHHIHYEQLEQMLNCPYNIQSCEEIRVKLTSILVVCN